MKLVTIVENTCGSNGCIAEHGLSIYIETEKHILLLDAGQTDAAIKNAARLGIDLSKVDTLILSHGHYDHSGGIMPFNKMNKNARIIMQSAAAEPHFNSKSYNGIDTDILNLPNVELINGDMRIDDELFLFSGIKGRRCYPQSNLRLYCLKDGKKIPDDFVHEQCLVITQGEKHILLSGCAHNGILNILDKYYELFGEYPDYVISGFHLMKRDGSYTDEEKEIIINTAKELSKLNTVFFSGHCTGIQAFKIMKEIMSDKLIALHSGDEIVLDSRCLSRTM